MGAHSPAAPLGSLFGCDRGHWQPLETGSVPWVDEERERGDALRATRAELAGLVLASGLLGN